QSRATGRVDLSVEGVEPEVTVNSIESDGLANAIPPAFPPRY
ncbi:MAG: hypothetical protein ACI8W3_003564, partial [Myxococcota bacterium]